MTICSAIDRQSPRGGRVRPRRRDRTRPQGLQAAAPDIAGEKGIDGTIVVHAKAPVDGGTPSAYRVTRRERPAGAWEDVATAVISEATLVEQPKGKELEYCIIAVNKAGEGEAIGYG